jgi:hypothetical protein
VDGADADDGVVDPLDELLVEVAEGGSDLNAGGIMEGRTL